MTDLQDPLPENSFKWRRWFTWITCAVTLAFVAYSIPRITDAHALKEVAIHLLYLNALYALLYLVAPSAVDVVKIVQGSKLFREQPGLAPTYPRRSPYAYRAQSVLPVELDARATPDDPDGDA